MSFKSCKISIFSNLKSVQKCKFYSVNLCQWGFEWDLCKCANSMKMDLFQDLLNNL